MMKMMMVITTMSSDKLMLGKGSSLLPLLILLIFPVYFYQHFVNIFSTMFYDRLM